MNSNNDFINEIKQQLRRIDNKSLDNKLIDYRNLLDQINEQIGSVRGQIGNMNDNLQDLKYRDGLDERSTLEELEKLRKLCEDHLENSVEDLYISYIPKLTALDNALGQNRQLSELESMLQQMSVLHEEINEKVERLDLNGSPLIKNLLDLAEKLKNKIEAKIEDLVYRQADLREEHLQEENLQRESLLNEQSEQALCEPPTTEPTKLTLKRPLNVSALDSVEFSVQRTPEATIYRPEQAAAIFKRQQSFDRPDTLQFTPPVLWSLNEQQIQTSAQLPTAPPPTDGQLDEIRRKLQNLNDSLPRTSQDYEKTKAKMSELIELISAVQSISEPTDSSKLQELNGELNQVVDRLTRLASDYIRTVCENEHTKPDKSVGDRPTKDKRLDKLLEKFRPRYESITEYRKFEKLTENNQDKLDALNRVISELKNLPINEKVKNLKVSLIFLQKIAERSIDFFLKSV